MSLREAEFLACLAACLNFYLNEKQIVATSPSFQREFEELVGASLPARDDTFYPYPAEELSAIRGILTGTDNNPDRTGRIQRLSHQAARFIIGFLVEGEGPGQKRDRDDHSSSLFPPPPPPSPLLLPLLLPFNSTCRSLHPLPTTPPAHNPTP